MELLVSTDEFFHQVVTDALEAHKVRLQDTTEYYVVNLLTRYTAERVDDEPLALKLAQVGLAEPYERVRLLKEVGDTALYLCGFFAESLSRRWVSVEYYMELGGAAYGQLARTGRLVSALLRSVCDELAACFPQVVKVLAQARSRLNLSSSANILRLYEQWTSTRSEFLAQRLRAAGFILPAPGQAC
jgi:hypothetical protein